MSLFKQRNSIQYTFLKVLIPALAVSFMIVATMIGLYQNEVTESKLAASQKSFVALLVQSLSDDYWRGDKANAVKILKLAANDNNILFIELSDEFGNVIAKVGEPVSGQGDIVSRAMHATESDYKRSSGKIRFQFSAANYKEAVIAEIIKAALMLLVSVMVITLVMTFVYREHILAPIQYIIKKLLAYGRGDSTALVNWESHDEFGALASSFKSMQQSLISNQRILVDSALRYQNLYNKTPALLFSMSNDAVITDTSVYFLQKLSYKKAYLVGLPISDMICDDFPGAGSEIAARLKDGGQLTNFQTCIKTNSGEKIDVLINTMSIPSSEDESTTMSLCVMTDISKQVHAQDTVFRQANYDVVTELPNRFFFNTRFRSLLDAALRSGSPATVIFIDLDRFKWVNDTFGHSVGDALLADAGIRIKNAFADNTLVCRFGGDEFIVALHASRKSVLKSKIVERLLTTMAEPFRIQQHEIHLSASIGISSFPHDGDNPDELIGAADTAMYHAKSRGGDTFEFFEGNMHDRIEKQLQLDHALRAGFQEDRFSLVFQPIVDIKNRTSNLFEVLIRFSHPDFPNVSPAEFIPLAETTGLIRPIGQFVIRNALLHLHALDNQGEARYSLTINFSPRELQDETFVTFLQAQLETYEIDPGRIIMEITENSLMENNTRIERMLEKVRELGCLIAIDDFGTGFSSLSYLRRFKVDILKIDQSFIQRVPNDEADSNLIRGIINMARELGIAVIAEGVEKKEQYDFLIENGCDLGQGYYFSKPVKAEDVYTNKINF